ncbi:hypothetical protein DEU56DRAFT_356143 [Suillus clintonianus]|uniref:uncharacterized protein n=1 Tax=Suillus clintonianus TaxID=1904413 RepID=UPI001B878E56|nr:uncharacterized protein DEU56DRAFT_356143 [Suillus clintonianus]KAG2136642.1 hypothetical protein DEU56DRAFT_356143 [Suillus clintonianus]
MCDQVMALVSPEHVRSIVWIGQEDDDTLMEIDQDRYEPDRMFTFEVRKTNEQEEAVKPRPGFKATSVHIAMPQPHPEVTEDSGLHKPWLLHGETTQGFMTINYLPATRVNDAWKRRSVTRLQLGDWLWVLLFLPVPGLFLAELDDMEKLPVMKKVVAGSRDAAVVYFRLLITMQTTTFTHSALRIQIDESVARAHRETAICDEQQLAESRKTVRKGPDLRIS